MAGSLSTIIIIIIIMTNANTRFHKQATGGKAGGKSRGRACSATTPSFQSHVEVAVQGGSGRSYL